MLNKGLHSERTAGSRKSEVESTYGLLRAAHDYANPQKNLAYELNQTNEKEPFADHEILPGAFLPLAKGESEFSKSQFLHLFEGEYCRLSVANVGGEGVNIAQSVPNLKQAFLHTGDSKTNEGIRMMRMSCGFECSGHTLIETTFQSSLSTGREGEEGESAVSKSQLASFQEGEKTSQMQTTQLMLTTLTLSARGALKNNLTFNQNVSASAASSPGEGLNPLVALGTRSRKRECKQLYTAGMDAMRGKDKPLLTGSEIFEKEMTLNAVNTNVSLPFIADTNRSPFLKGDPGHCVGRGFTRLGTYTFKNEQNHKFLTK